MKLGAEEIPPMKEIQFLNDEGLKKLYSDFWSEWSKEKKGYDEGNFMEAYFNNMKSVERKYEVLIREYKLSKFKDSPASTLIPINFWVNTPKGSGYVLYVSHSSNNENDILTVALQESGKILHFDITQLTYQANHTLEINIENNKPDFPSDKFKY